MIMKKNWIKAMEKIRRKKDKNDSTNGRKNGKKKCRIKIPK